jgi:hypothetical protein
MLRCCREFERIRLSGQKQEVDAESSGETPFWRGISGIAIVQ